MYLTDTPDNVIYYYSQSVVLPVGYFSFKRPHGVDVDLVSYVEADFANAFDNKQSRTTYLSVWWSYMLAISVMA